MKYCTAGPENTRRYTGAGNDLKCHVTLNIVQADPEKRSCPVDEAAKILGVSKRSVYKLCSEGSFKSVRIGTKLRFSKKSFDEWLDGNI